MNTVVDAPIQRVQSEAFSAVQYEFYIPKSILKHKAVVEFLSWLEAYVKGATQFAGLLGFFPGYQPEEMTIYRKLVRLSIAQLSNASDAIRNEVEKLFAHLSVDKDAVQKEVWFTEAVLELSRTFRAAPF